MEFWRKKNADTRLVFPIQKNDGTFITGAAGLDSEYALLGAHGAAAHGTAYQGPTTIYLEIVSDTPTASTAGTPIEYTSYARASMSNAIGAGGWTSDGVGGLVNQADVEFPAPTGGLGDTAVAVEAWTAATAGTRLWYEELDSMVDITGETPNVLFRAGELHWSVV